MSTSPEGRGRGSRFVEIPAVLVLIIMAVHVVANAAMRTFWNSPIPNTLETVQYWYLPIVALLGIIAAQSRGQHLAADLAYRHLPAFGRRVFSIVGLVLCVAVCAGFAWFGLLEALEAYKIKKTAGVTRLTVWPVYFLVPVTFSYLLVQYGRLLLTGQSLEGTEELTDVDIHAQDLADVTPAGPDSDHARTKK